MTIYHYHWSCRNASCLGNSWASCWELLGVGQWFIVCTSAAVILRFTSSWPHLRCAVGLEELLLLCYIVVYYYNGAQLYEQFLQAGLLDRARILLGLALCLLYLSWACWDWPLTWLTCLCLSVLWHCRLGHLTRKVIPDVTYNVSSGTLCPAVPVRIPVAVVVTARE